ncbi:MAG: hypothetical protein U1F83_20660 [Verrucomicrobiota bacterium]
MTTNETKRYANKAGLVSGFKQACLKSCDKVIDRIKETKAAILAEARGNAQASDLMLRMAVAEAEAIAWQTHPASDFPDARDGTRAGGLELERPSATGAATESRVGAGDLKLQPKRTTEN